MIEQQFLDEGAKHPTLGPHYFVSRELAQKITNEMDPRHFEEIAKRASSEIYDLIRQKVEDFLVSDVESNIQGTMWRQIDESVKALLSGEEWALKRYALGSRYDHDKIRAAIAKHIPKELQDARVADLEAKLKRAKEDLAFYRNR